MAQFGNTEIYGTLNVTGKVVTRRIITDDGFTVSGGLSIDGYEGPGTTLCLIDSAGALKRDAWNTSNSSSIVVKPSSTTKGICYVSGSQEAGSFFGGSSGPMANDETRLNYSGNFYAGKVFNAWWNDIADFITIPENTQIEYGKAYTIDEELVRKTNKLGEKNIGIATDTFGYGVGVNSEKNQMPIAVCGFVLAYIDKEYQFGTPLIATKDGILTKANLFTKIFRTDRIIAKYYKKEKEERYNGSVNVNGRHWVKVC